MSCRVTPAQCAAPAADVVAEPMFLLLVACGAIYMVLGDRNEAFMLLGFVFVVMGITFVQERRAERSLEALRDLSSPRALVVRDGKARQLAGRELVRDDIVLLAEGDRVPADMDLLESSNLRIDESMLTGESVPVTKEDSARRARRACRASEDESRVFSGTLVTQGTAARPRRRHRRAQCAGPHRQVAAGTGQRDHADPAGDPPLSSSAWPSSACSLPPGSPLVYGLRTGDWLQGLLAGLTLAMAVLPEELPVVLTLFLGLGAWRSRARERACAQHPGGRTAGRHHGAVRRQDRHADAPTACACGALVERRTSTTTTQPDRSPCPKPSTACWSTPCSPAIGAPSIRWSRPSARPARACWPTPSTCTPTGHWCDDYPLVARDCWRCRASWQSPDQRHRMIAAKGAPEAIVDLCHLDLAARAEIAAQVAAMAAGDCACSACARSTLCGRSAAGQPARFRLRVPGPGRRSKTRCGRMCRQAIAECRAAGIRVVMITGDHPATALAIARAGRPDGGRRS